MSQPPSTWATMTADRPARLVTDDGVRIGIAPDAAVGPHLRLDAIHPGQRVLVRVTDGVAVAIEFPTADLVVHSHSREN